MIKSQNLVKIFPKQLGRLLTNATRKEKRIIDFDIVNIKSGNDIITGPLEVASEFNNLFSKVALPDQNFKEKSTRSQILNSMVLFPTDENEITKIIQYLRTKRSCDIDELSVWMLKKFYKFILY